MSAVIYCHGSVSKVLINWHDSAAAVKRDKLIFTTYKLNLILFKLK